MIACRIFRLLLSGALAAPRSSSAGDKVRLLGLPHRLSTRVGTAPEMELTAGYSGCVKEDLVWSVLCTNANAGQ